MPQVTLYLDQATAKRLKAAARRAGLSRSRWLAALIREREAGEWPQAVRELAGSWAELETARGLRRRTGRDAPRVRF
jgi:hypothetical protein